MAAMETRAVLLVLTVLLATPQGNTWTQLSPASSPTGVGRATMVWDEVDGGLYLFGGEEQNTWVFLNRLVYYSVASNTWTSKSTTNALEGRHTHSAVLDPAARRMYIFGGMKRGIHSSTAGATFSDLFRYDLATDSWTQLTGDSTPRARHAAVWDSSNNRMIVYGGEADDKDILGDVSEYSPSSDTWTSPSIAGGSPHARRAALAVWDTNSNRMLLCCGSGDTNVHVPYTGTTDWHYNDLWSYADGVWVELQPQNSLIEPREDAPAAWDSTTQSMLSFGGYRWNTGSSTAIYLDSIIVYATTTGSWSEEVVAGPAARDGGSAAFDPAASDLYMLGGWAGGAYENVLWRLSATHTSVTTTSSSSSVSATSSSISTETSSTSSSTSQTTSRSSSSTQSSTVSSSSTTRSTSSSSSVTTSASSTATETLSSSTSTTLSSSATSSSSSESSSMTSSLTSTSSRSTSTTGSSSTTSQSSSLTSTSSQAVASSSTTSSSSSTTTAEAEASSTSSSSTTAEAEASSTSSSSTTAEAEASSTSSSSSRADTTASSSSTTSSSGTSTSHSWPATSTFTSSTSHQSLSTTGRPSSSTTSQSVSTTSTMDAAADSRPPSGPTMEETNATAGSDATVLQLLADVEQAEGSAVTEIMAMLESGNESALVDANVSAGVLGRGFVRRGSFEVSVWALDPGSVSTTLSLRSGSSDLRVPPQVVAEALTARGGEEDFLFVTAATLDLEGLPAALSSSRTLLSTPVSWTFRRSDGGHVLLENLVQPIELRLRDIRSMGPTSPPGRVRCMFWDEESDSWSGEGIETRAPSLETGLMCLTRHLTIFGAILEAFQVVLSCSTASEVLSVEGLRKLAATKWLSHTATVLTFIALACFVVALAWAMYLDKKAQQMLPDAEVEATLMATRGVSSNSEDEEPADDHRARRCARCRACAGKVLDGGVWLVGTMFEVQAADSVSELFDFKVAAVNRCIAVIHSYRAGACRHSIRAVMASSGERKLRRPSVRGNQDDVVRTTTSASVAMETWNVHFHGVRAVELYLRSSWLRRVVMLVPAMHPWLSAAVVSLFRSHTVRVALIVLKLLSAAFTNALFFTNGAQDSDAAAECSPPQTFGEQLTTATIVGFLSACLGDVLIVALALIQRRQVVVRDAWTPQMRRRRRRLWRLRQWLFWFIWLMLFAFATLYVLSFLANVSSSDSGKWLESTGVSVLQDMILKPTLLAVGYATLTTFLLLCNPRVKDTITQRWVHPDEDLVEEMTGEKPDGVPVFLDDNSSSESDSDPMQEVNF